MIDDVNKYFADPAISQSSLKALNKGLGKYKKYIEAQKEGGLFYTDDTLFYSEKEGIIIGEAVDYILTYGEDAFNEKFSFMEEEKPGDKLVSIMHKTLEALDITLANMDETPSKYSMSTFRSAFIDSANLHKYQIRWKDETRFNKMEELGANYWTYLVKSRGKYILSKNEYEVIRLCANSLKKHPVTSKYLHNVMGKGIEVHMQKAIFWIMDGEPCKALLDRFIINHEKKVIIPIDYKVTYEEPSTFHYKANKLRYDIQAAWYTLALTQYCIQNDLVGYTIQNFMFLVVSYNNIKHPFILRCSDDILAQGKNGFTKMYGTEATLYKKGYTHLFEEYKWYRKHGFEIEKELVDNNNVLTWKLN